MGTIPMDPATLSQYLQYPIQAPPPGVTPNFVNPDSTSYQVYATGPCVSGGAFGRHAWNILLGAFTKSQLILALLVEILLPVAICLVKVSVLLLYLRIFRVLNWMRVVSVVSIVLIVLWHLALSVSFAAMCAPGTGDTQLDFLAAFISQKCSDTRILVVLQGVGNVVTDIWLILLPLPAVWTLQMPNRRKLAVSSMFMVGIIACVASIVGLVYRAQYYTAGEDNIRLVVPLWVTCMVEETAGVIICCSPMTTKVFHNVKQPVVSWLSSISQRRKSGHTGSSNSKNNTGENRGYSGGSQGSQGPIYRHQQDQQNEKGLVNNNSTHNNNNSLHQIATNAIYDPVNPQDGHAAWADANGKDEDTEQLHPGVFGIERKTEYQVSRDGLGH
ncbi:hypothetical protein PG991_008228 [Apiospora marii]|uniref:Rhodopsin domain-containing protein n=1 Tax=Apiospora marii TaxID=335849 RepID=A0ABR1RQP2_9PEZI